MRTKVPSSLKWLVDKRARLATELDRNKKEARAAALRASTLDAKLSQLKMDLAAIDRALSMHEIRIHPETIAPIRTQRSGRLLPFSHLSRSIVSYLRRANGAWCSTTEIMTFIAEAGKLDVDEEVYPILRLSVRKRLQTLHAAGRVIRRHAAKTSMEGYWAVAPARTVRSKS